MLKKIILGISFCLINTFLNASKQVKFPSIPKIRIPAQQPLESEKKSRVEKYAKDIWTKAHDNLEYHMSSIYNINKNNLNSIISRIKETGIDVKATNDDGQTLKDIIKDTAAKYEKGYKIHPKDKFPKEWQELMKALEG